MKKSLLLAGLLALPCLAAAEVNEKFAAFNDEIEMVRSMADMERRTVITRNLYLSGTESTQFWKLYDEYATDRKRINDRLVAIITNYAAVNENMSDEQARSMVKDYMKIQSDLLKLRKKHMRRFERVLSAKNYARFFQIDNKLNVVGNLTLAQGIPLVVD